MTTPRIIDKYLHVAQDGYGAVERRYIGRKGTGKPKAIFLHIQEGNNWGSWQHFHVVSASCTVLIGRNGDIWRLVPESDSPWTNGDVKSPSAKGRELINRYGPDPNVYSLTIETEGKTGEWPKTQAQLDSVVWQIKTWMQRYNIPLSRLYRHADVNSVTRSFCPGNAYFAYVVARIEKELKESTGDGTGGAKPPAPTFAKPIIIPELAKYHDADPDTAPEHVLLSDGTPVYYVHDRIKTTKQTPRLRWASPSAPLLGEDIPEGYEFDVTWALQAADGKFYYITPYWTRVIADDTTRIGD